jgi:acetyltransferase
MFRRLSPRTVVQRFFTLTPLLSAPLLRALTDVDHDRHEALVVQVGDELVALASYARRADDRTVADVALLVEDGWQRHGVGRRLLRDLVRTARAAGVETLHADVLVDNFQVKGLITRVDASSKPYFADGNLAYDWPLSPAGAAA